MKTVKVTIWSYKAAQFRNKDYVRRNGKFLKFLKSSGNHRCCQFELFDGDEFDARASRYIVGATKWTAGNCQSWAKFRNEDGVLKAYDFSGKQIDLPHWITASAYEDAEAVTVSA